MSTIINGSTNAITFPDATIQTTAFKAGAVTQSTIATGVAGTGPAFSAYPTSTQVIASNTNTKIAYGTEYFDTASCFDTSTYRFTPTVAGYYQVNAQIRDATGPASGQIVCYIYKNGASQNFSVNTFAGSVGTSVSCSTIISMNGTTDYLEVYISQNSGSNLTVSASGASNYFQASLARAA